MNFATICRTGFLQLIQYQLLQVTKCALIFFLFNSFKCFAPTYYPFHMNISLKKQVRFLLQYVFCWLLKIHNCNVTTWRTPLATYDDQFSWFPGFPDLIIDFLSSPNFDHYSSCEKKRNKTSLSISCVVRYKRMWTWKFCPQGTQIISRCRRGYWLYYSKIFQNKNLLINL